MSDIQLRHGIFLAPYHPIGESPTTLLRRDIEYCKLWEDLGYNEVWVGEHHSGGMEIIASPELFIAAAAEATTRIRFGTGVISLPYHNPLMVANRIAQLDHQTQGRVSFGFGPGLLMGDAHMQAIEPKLTRNRMLEALDVIIRLLKGEEVTETSEWYTLQNARAHLLPYTRPLPEIAVASAGTPSGGKAAGKYGASMLCVAASDSGGFNVLDTNWQIACETAAEYGNTMDRRNLRLVAPIHIAETREQAFKNVEWGLDEWGDYYELVSPNPFKAKGKELPKKLVESKRAVIGTPDDAIEMIERMQGKQGEFGVFLAQHVDWADPAATRKSYELYARYVMPHFAKTNANRRATQDWMIEQNTNFQDRRKTASDAAFAQHEAEQSEKKAHRKAGE
ncbi:LLM class flavin-dependent oxidoreductase [Pseudooceanicola sp. 216_PA32_1]|uniref:LLM class flavin-dependent oxidoreductase n=1 Tax=Pseudooceanicola pacificus TaxID=2676438 RepID=A0A844WFD6_9RHOB|nr:LLM class flavin-dependent oxidoreductase [Pseudooceanicola pacificus]MWB78159.1 LLM class flavin-dependent oxidoreductase [Pseudooceanicola pacificus]